MGFIRSSPVKSIRPSRPEISSLVSFVVDVAQPVEGGGALADDAVVVLRQVADARPGGPTSILPASGSSCPASIFTSVVLPTPFWPMTQIFSPLVTSAVKRLDDLSRRRSAW